MSDYNETIEYLEGRRRLIEDKIAWFKQHGPVLSEFPRPTVGMSLPIDFDCLPHNQVIGVIKALGGTWKKTVNPDGIRVDYQATIDGQEVRCWAGEPPPSCKIVEVETTIPAQPEKKVITRKLVCPHADALYTGPAKGANE